MMLVFVCCEAREIMCQPGTKWLDARKREAYYHLMQMKLFYLIGIIHLSLIISAHVCFVRHLSREHETEASVCASAAGMLHLFVNKHEHFDENLVQKRTFNSRLSREVKGISQKKRNISCEAKHQTKPEFHCIQLQVTLKVFVVQDYFVN